LEFTLEYPSDMPTAGPEFLEPAVLSDIVRCAEDAGFAAVALSEHPAPSLKWRQGGGHDTLDLIAALAFIAGVTSDIKLMSNLYILTYRNPYLAAKALASLDILSGGRVIAGVGPGYLRSEFAAVGADFAKRAPLFDEALTLVRKIWTRPDEPVGGDGFVAHGTMWLHPPVQQPHPPIWIGGNSSAARRRVVEHGQGWSPLIAPRAVASSLRTPAIEDARQFGVAVNELKERLQAAGRDPAAVAIQVEFHLVDFDDPSAVRRAEEELSEMAEYGATWAIAHVDATTPQASMDYIAALGEIFIHPQHGRRAQ
jgi:probable F420-dependent oxidoreductase